MLQTTNTIRSALHAYSLDRFLRADAALFRDWVVRPHLGLVCVCDKISWVLRPFIWDPAGLSQFIGRQYFHGSFYETVFEAVRRLLLGD